MEIRTAEADWRGTLRGGSGRLQFGRGAYDGCYSFRAQMAATNPEELVGAALAGCFSMELAAQLARAGFTVEHIRTRASVQVEEHAERWSIDGIGLETEAAVPGISAAAFAEQAERIARESAILRALAGVEVRVVTKLLETQGRGRAAPRPKDRDNQDPFEPAGREGLTAASAASAALPTHTRPPLATMIPIISAAGR